MNSGDQVSTQQIISTQKLSKSVTTGEGELIILRSVDLSIDSGETLAIVGASGSGKSTLLGLLAGLDCPTNGKVYLAGECITDMDEDGRALVRSRHVGFVFQSFQLINSLTAVENVMLPLDLGNYKDPKGLAERWMKRVGLSHRLNHFPSQLSGGEQQRVAVARAFATEPSLLFADEPTGNLDRTTGKQIIDLLFELNRENQMTLVLVTHDDGLASRCRRIVRLDEGQVSQLITQE